MQALGAHFILSPIIIRVGRLHLLLTLLHSSQFYSVLHQIISTIKDIVDVPIFICKIHSNSKINEPKLVKRRVTWLAIINYIFVLCELLIHMFFFSHHKLRMILAVMFFLRSSDKWNGSVPWPDNVFKFISYATHNTLDWWHGQWKAEENVAFQVLSLSPKRCNTQHPLPYQRQRKFGNG